MRKFIITVSVLLTISFNLFPQWSNDPNNNLIIGFGWDPHIVSDSAGGCYVTYNYESFYPQKLAVERLDMYGYKPWGDKIQILGELPEQWQAEIVEDGEGGVIVSYQDNEVIGFDYITRVRVQRVDSNGNFLWGQTGVRVTLEEINHGGQNIVSDGAGGAVVIWVNNVAEYKVNRINRDGQRMWGDSGIVLGINGYGDPALLVRTTGNQYVASPERNTYKYFDENGNVFYTGSVIWLNNIISDGNGGIILVSRGGQWPSNWQLRAQRKDSLGNSLWQEPHIVVADSVVPNSVVFILSNQGYYFFSWVGKFNSINYPLYQGLRFDGSKLFPSSSFLISDVVTNITSIPIINSDSLNNVIIWTNSIEYIGTWGQRVDTLGIKKWGDDNVLLNFPELNYLNVTNDCYGGAIGVGYLNADFAIRVFKVSANGKLGEVITSAEIYNEDISLKQSFLYQNFPNPFNSHTVIKYQIHNEGRVNISLYNILGERLENLSDEYKSSGIYSLTFNSDDLPTGVYIYTMETDNQILAKKLTIIK